jgi:osmotically-inducible protein OsmY
LAAYNPSGFSRYRFEVKDGVVTINGEAAHQPEKDGVDSVLKLITGVKSVVNSLKVKPDEKVKLDEALAPVKLNLAEAKILDEALRREVESREQATNVAPPNPPQQPKQNQPSDAQRDAQLRAAAKFREEDMATRRAAEEKIRRDAEEYERKQEELRRAEAERRARAEQSRVEVVSLRSGTVAWSGTVDGVDEVVISGSSASVRHVNGASPREVKASFSAPVPRSPVSVALISANGRGAISVVQQPSAANGYTTIVRVDDSSKGGDKRYEFTLRWTAQ